ncbi:hypothetical protein [Bacillus weihaiensis]|uniref:Uncharacterized protein n=1 Tax=Bacillus weihaiensis TaxID=1547283 RepID=A0A1L3MS09_9BACI|nr:hypothetical protein [Bacillus weihaiensis]APH05044.1 hypothetical protein A9C19_09950 [Bacillus weihaiensis]
MYNFILSLLNTNAGKQALAKVLGKKQQKNQSFFWGSVLGLGIGIASVTMGRSKKISKSESNKQQQRNLFNIEEMLKKPDLAMGLAEFSNEISPKNTNKPTN